MEGVYPYLEQLSTIRLNYEPVYSILMPKGIFMADIKTVRPGAGSHKRLDTITVTGAMAERRMADGRRKLMPSHKEKTALMRQRNVEAAVALFLDLEHDHSYEEIARTLGFSTVTLRKLTKSQEFMDCWNEHFIELGHDPRLRATQAALTDMLPMAIREMKQLLLTAPPNVRFAVIKEVIRLNGIDTPKAPHSDTDELKQFLTAQNVNIVGTMNINPGAEYQKNIEAYQEGRFSDIDSHEAAVKRLGVGVPEQLESVTDQFPDPSDEEG